jgi:2-polyprenyl-3-methyl-5-hydroxy-6-metoxy-1,4-benzoquinol methylase
MSDEIARSAAIAQGNMRDRVYGDTIYTALLDLFEPGRRVLDIGCGTGAWVPALRAKGAQSLVGIEFATDAADRAERVYDRIIRRPVENVELADLGGQPFDTIIAADVIEHLVDPWRELRRWTEWAAPGGQLVVSVPNVRYFKIVGSLIQGRFDYSDAPGLMDRTHLRWFTRRSLTHDLEAAGWRPRRWGSPDSGGRHGQLNRATLGRFGEFFTYQLRVVAERSGRGS